MTLRDQLLERSGNCCESCLVENYSIGYYKNENWVKVVVGLNYNQATKERNRRQELENKICSEVERTPKRYRLKRLMVFFPVGWNQNQGKERLSIFCQKCHRQNSREAIKMKRKQRALRGQFQIQFNAENNQ